MIDEARPDLDEEDAGAIAPQVGIGAVKYADLSVAHDSDYVFDLERMLALTGNTGPYLQYAARADSLDLSHRRHATRARLPERSRSPSPPSVHSL